MYVCVNLDSKMLKVVLSPCASLVESPQMCAIVESLLIIHEARVLRLVECKNCARLVRDVITSNAKTSFFVQVAWHMVFDVR